MRYAGREMSFRHPWGMPETEQVKLALTPSLGLGFVALLLVQNAGTQIYRE